MRLIGDVVFTTPLIAALVRRYPGATLTYLVEQAAAPVVSGHPDLHEVLVVQHQRGWKRLAADVTLARALRARRFDLAIDLHGGPRSAWLTWASRAPRRVGYDVTGRAWMYTTVVHRPRGLHPRHSVANQWDLLAGLDDEFRSGPDPERDRTVMPVKASARQAVAVRLTQYGVPADARVIVLHVSAGNPFRRWPEASFAALASGLVTGAADRVVLVTSGPSDHGAAARVVADAGRAAGARRSAVVDAEGLSLEELRALMERAAVFVGGDSGPLHIASTSDVPIVGLFGPTLAARSAPWRPARLPSIAVDAGALPCRPCDQRACAPGDFRCLTGIDPAVVRAAAERLLGAPQ